MKTLRSQVASSLSALLHNRPLRNQTDITNWALRDISFEVRRGEVLGVIGANGSGKSTLLKILSKIMRPTTGWVGINGKVSSLLGVGAGFNPLLTGRENIYLSGAVLGLIRAEIVRSFDEIVAFSEIGQMLDTPVKFYSSGMYVRLAFSIAVHLNPDTLLIDEVLAVGDAAFREKSMARMKQLVSDKDRTIVFVSHDSSAVEELCSACIYLHQGRLIAAGEPKMVLAKYRKDIDIKSLADQTVERLKPDDRRSGDDAAQLTKLRFLSATTLQPLPVINSGQDLVIEAKYQAQDTSANTVAKLSLTLTFFNQAGHFVTELNSQKSPETAKKLPAAGCLYCWIPRFPLMAGAFRVATTLALEGRTVHHLEHAALIQVKPDANSTNVQPVSAGRQGVYIDHEWSTTIDAKRVVAIK